MVCSAAGQQLRTEGFPIKAEDVARISPLIFDHINLLGDIPSYCPIRFSVGNSARAAAGIDQLFLFTRQLPCSIILPPPPKHI